MHFLNVVTEIALTDHLGTKLATNLDLQMDFPPMSLERAFIGKNLIAETGGSKWPGTHPGLLSVGIVVMKSQTHFMV